MHFSESVYYKLLICCDGKSDSRIVLSNLLLWKVILANVFVLNNSFLFVFVIESYKVTLFLLSVDMESSCHGWYKTTLSHMLQ